MIEHDAIESYVAANKIGGFNKDKLLTIDYSKDLIYYVVIDIKSNTLVYENHILEVWLISTNNIQNMSLPNRFLSIEQLISNNRRKIIKELL